MNFLYLSRDERRKIKYKWEFLKRKKIFRDLIKKLGPIKGVTEVDNSQADQILRSKITKEAKRILKEIESYYLKKTEGGWKRSFQFNPGRELNYYWAYLSFYPLFGDGKIDRFVEDFLSIPSSISIITNREKEFLKIKNNFIGTPLTQVESRGFKYWHEKRKNPKEEEFYRNQELIIDAVDREEKTITVKISLNRKKSEIRGDLDFLLALLDKEAKYLGIDFERQKHRPAKESESIFDKYDLYLKVWDKKENENKSFPKIAKEMFPSAFKFDEPEKDNFGDDESGPIDPAESAIKKVKRYYQEAKRRIEGIGQAI